MTACAQTKPVVTASCGWLQVVHPDAGFETRWTHDEKVQIVTLNDQIKKECGGH